MNPKYCNVKVTLEFAKLGIFFCNLVVQLFLIQMNQTPPMHHLYSISFFCYVHGFYLVKLSHQNR